MLLRNSLILIVTIVGFSINSYCQDLIPYRVGNKWGFADDKGKLVYEAEYDSVGVFERNKTLKTYGSMVYKGERSTYINKTNKPIFDANYKNIYHIYREWIIAKDNNDELRLFDSSLMKFSDFTFDDYHAEYDFLIVEKEGKIGVIDSKSEIIIPLEYDQIIYTNFNDCSINYDDYQNHKLSDFNLENKEGLLYLDGEKLSEDKDLLLAVVINDRVTKRVLKLVRQKIVEDEDDEIYFSTIESTEAYSENSNPLLEKISKKENLVFTECNDKIKACIYKKDYKYGIYNIKTNSFSELFDKIESISNYNVYKVKKDGKQGVIDKDFKELMPIKYSYLSVDYKSGYLITSSFYKTESMTDSKYDYYNLKTNRYFIKDCDFLYGGYIRKSSESGVFYIAVNKNNTIFYVNENGIKYIQK
ncbi:MAG: WG repeat-containing protein [Winogradskyella sp.]|nr:WG repeat-containing protein [Winogradskyella sp.]